MTFMHEGGVAMWLTLVIFAAATAGSLLRRKQDGSRIALSGAVLVIASGLVGFATGLYAVVSHIGGLEVAERVDAMGMGLSESVHNVLFAAVLSVLLAIVAIVIAPRKQLAAA
jgi:hypothetical protein